MTRTMQGAFNGGIIAEGMYARNDTEKYNKGLKDAVNVFLRPQGGFANRAGTFATTAFDTSGATDKQFLIPFSFNTEQNYHLEFTDAVFRVIKDGAYVLDSTASAIDITAITTADPAQITLTDIADAALFTVGELVFIDDPAGDHKLGQITVEISAISGDDLTFKVYDGTTLDTSTLDWGVLGAGATISRIYQTAHPYDLADLPAVRFAQDADTMYFAHPLYPPQKCYRSDHDDWTFEVVNYGRSILPPTSLNRAISNVTQATTGRVTCAGGPQPLLAGGTISIDGVVGMTELNGNTYVIQNPNVGGTEFDLYEVGGDPLDTSAFTAYTSGGTVTAPNISAVQGPDVDPLDLTRYYYVVSSVKADTGEESLQSNMRSIQNDLLFYGSINTFSWPAAEGAERYNVYKQSAGAYGYIGTTTTTSFDDENITPDVSRGPRLDRLPFAAPGDYPSIVSFYEQRLAYARTINDPQLVEASRVDNVENFDVSFPDQPDDAFRFRLRARRVDAVRAFIPHEALGILTSGGEWEIAPQDNAEYLRPDKRRLSPTSYYGSFDIEPVLIGGVALFVTPSGDTIRDYKLGDRSQPPGDLTILSRDLFRGKTVTSWTYCQAPDGLLWVTLSDGSLLSMTYIAEHDIWGWTRHEIGGTDVFVHQVSSNQVGVEEFPLFVVSRTINGVTVTMTEQLAHREETDVKECYYVDAGLKYDTGVPASGVFGLLHLRGETVSALLDGDVHLDLTVDATGSVDFGAADGLNISIGLPYVAAAETLGVNMEIKGLGSSEGRLKSTSEIAVKLEKSRGVEVGQRLDAMTAQKEWEPSMIGVPIPLTSSTQLFDVDGDWVRDATIHVRQLNPLPMTVTAISPEWEIGG